MAAILRAVSSSFAVLHNRYLRIYLGGQALSLVGTWVQATAQGWVVWKLTGSTVSLGITAALSTVPLLLLAPWTGAWADHYDRRKLLIGTQSLAITFAFVLASLVLSNSVQLWQVYVLSLLLGIVTAVEMPAQQAFLGDLAGMDEVRQAVNLNGMIAQGSRLVGPALAAILIAAFGSGVAFLLNGLSFLAVIASLVVIRNAHIAQSRRPGGNALGGFAEALRFVRSAPRLADLIFFVILLTFFGTPIVANMLPAVASQLVSGDAATLGMLMSVAGGGALVGTVVVAPWARTVRRTGLFLSLAGVGAALCFLVLATSHRPPISAAALFAAGMITPPVFFTVAGLLQVNSPAAMRARIMSLFSMVSYGLQPVAALWVGWSASHLGLRQAIALNASLMMAGALVMLSRPAVNRWDSTQPGPGQPAGTPGYGVAVLPAERGSQPRSGPAAGQ